MPNSEQLYLAVLGTLVCLLGFLRKPTSTFDLSRPRFVVPFVIWMATFYQVLWRYLAGPHQLASRYGQYRQQFGSQAEMYIILCLLAFWIGYFTLRFDKLGDRLWRASQIRLVEDSRLMSWSFWLAMVVAATTVVIIGPGNLWSNSGNGAALSESWLHFASLVKVLAVFRKYINTLLVVASAAILGLTWPTKDRRDAAHYIIAAAVLAMDSLPYAVGFSRGAGLPVVVAIAAYAYKQRRIPWIATIAGAVWTILVMNVALAGRSNFGHFAGLYPWGEQLASTASEVLRGNFSPMITTVNTLIDALTPTSVCMAGLSAGHAMGRLSTANWLIFQAPFPHFILPTVKYTIEPTRFLGGAGSWGYTPSVFGETWIEFRWMGAVAFAFMGMSYRFIDRLSGGGGNHGAHSAGIFVLMLPISYIALYLGLFLDFRAWWALTIFGFYLLAGGAYLSNQIVQRSSEFAGFADAG